MRFYDFHIRWFEFAARLQQEQNSRFVIAGLVPAISIRRAQCAGYRAGYRDGRDKPAMTK
jgi:hypothetical protein